MSFAWHLVPPICLASGLALGMTGRNARIRDTRTLGRLSLQASVIALGLTIPFDALLRASRLGLWTTLASLAVVAVAGLILARCFNTPSRLAVLITVGTGICGGSAIAAAAPLIRASDEDVTAALAIVFLLNAAALVLFPWLGHVVGLSPQAFAIWAATSIHDTSSVVGAALSFGEASLADATTIKMTRTLWIIPTSLVLFGYFRQRHPAANPAMDHGAEGPWSPPRTGRSLQPLPWFLVFFLLATLLRSLVGPGAWVTAASAAAKTGLGISLFCIGAAVTPKTLRQASSGALKLGLALWLIAMVWGFFLAQTARS